MTVTKILKGRASLYDVVAKRHDRLTARSPVPHPSARYVRHYAMPLSKGGEGASSSLAYSDLGSRVGDVGDGLLAIDESTCSAGFVITTPRSDRHGDVVLSTGCLHSLQDYANNPQVFFAHKSDEKPIATARKPGTDNELTLWAGEDRIVSRAYFHCKTEESNDVWGLVASGVLRATSIGFVPEEGTLLDPPPNSIALIDPNSPPPEGEVVSFDSGGIVFTKWSLLEYSVVPVPANPDALRQYLCSKGVTKSESLRRRLAPHATPLKRNQVRGGYVARTPASDTETVRWNPALSKKFDIESQKLRPASLEYDFAARHLGCKVKEIHQQFVAVPSTKLGSFLSGWRDATAAYQVADVRNITYGGSEKPPVHEVIRLNSKRSEDFLIEGSVFYDGSMRFIACLSPAWYGLTVTLYAHRKDKAKAHGLVEKAWDLAATEYNFLKGEAFSLSGEFLPRTKDSWDDIFLTPKNSKCLTRTLRQLNEKGLGFANRGCIFMGPPGTGKTLSGRAIRNDAKATFIWVSAKDFYRAGAFGGLSYAFELAKELSPAVLFLEDVDHWLSSTSVDLLKTEMDGISRYSGVWTVLTTNFPEHLPEALIDRPGRFHDVLMFDLPDESARTRMLKRWLPGIEKKAEALADALKATRGYSGAHVYELAHFARTLQEQDKDLGLDTALREAIAKIQEQRDLIQSVHKRHGPRETYKSAALVSRYLSRRKWRRKLKTTPRTKTKMPITDPLVSQSPNHETPSGPHDSAGEKQEAVQALVFHSTHFRTEDECKTWLTDNGFHADQLLAGEEQGEPFVAIQFDADECELDTAARQKAEEGVEVVTCRRKSEYDETDRPDTSNEPEGVGDGNIPSQQNSLKPKTKSKTKRRDTKVKTKSRVDGEGHIDGPNAVVRDDEEAQGSKMPDKPFGAQVLCDMHGRMCDMEEYLGEAIGLLDHPQVKKYAEKLHKAVTGHKEEVAALGSKHYPDHFEEAEKPENEDEEMEPENEDEEVEEEEEEEEEDGGEDVEPPIPEAPEGEHESEDEDGAVMDEDEESDPDHDGDDLVPDNGYGSDDGEEHEDEEEKPEGDGEDEVDSVEGDDTSPEDDEEGNEKPDTDSKPKPKKPKGKPKKKPRLADEERSAKPKTKVKIQRVVRKGMARKDLGVVKDAADFLEELSGEENLKKSQRKACQAHASEIGSLHTKYSAPSTSTETTDAKSATVDPATLRALEALERDAEALTRWWYEQTGEELEV